MTKSHFLFLLTASLALTSFATAHGEPTLEQRLERLGETLEAARVEAHVPGMSIAIIKDDEIVWTRGFGLADVATERPADENTIYAVGSTTKAFTATLVGMLVDEGKASWDDPVTKYLPYFDLQVQSDDEDAEVALRDLLSHRHGFTRMGVLVIGGKASREEVLRTAAGAEPCDDFRKGFHYCNVTYLAAGVAAGVAAGSSWDEMMVERIFKPLEMNSSTLSISEAQKDPRLALGYRWDEDLGRFEHMKMLDLSFIGPAGAINSNVIDMAKWVRLQLSKGEIDGKRLISTVRLLETWEPQIKIDPGASYGLGWMLREHDGRKIIEHGGNIDGFSAEVGLMPEENLGYVLLMNSNVSPLREASVGLVFDALLGEWPDETVGEKPANGAVVDAEEIDLDDFVGNYIANFAKFRDAEFEILINDGRLSLDMAGQRSTDLEQPDAEGTWVSTMSDQFAISFDRDDQGVVTGLRVHTSGFKFMVPRKGHEIEPDVPARDLEKYVGAYVRVQGGKRVEISIERGFLAMDNRGTLLVFNSPNAEGHASLRAREDQGATFSFDAEGNAESFIYHGNAGDRLFTRLVDSWETRLPTLDEILALRKTDARLTAMKSNGVTRVTGEVWFAQAGLHGTLTIFTQGSNRYASHMDFGNFGRVSDVSRGGEAWSYNSLRGFETHQGDKLAQAILAHPGAIEGNWNDYFDSIEVIGSDTVNDRSVYVVRLKKGDLPSRIYRVDTENGDVLRMNRISIELWGRIPITTTYSDFEEIDGIRRPQRVEIMNPSSGKTVLTYERIESGLELGDDVFTLEDPDAKD